RSTCLRVLRIGRTHRTLPVLDPGEFDLVPAALFVPLLHTLEPAADDSRQREDQPPELPDVVHPHQTNSTLGARCPVRDCCIRSGPTRREVAIFDIYRHGREALLSTDGTNFVSRNGHRGPFA